MDLCNHVSFLNQLPRQFRELPAGSGDDSRRRTEHLDEFKLLFAVALLRFQPGQLSTRALDFFRAGSFEQHLEFALGFSQFIFCGRFELARGIKIARGEQMLLE